MEVETSVTVEGQTDTQTATVRQGTQGPKGTSYHEEHCPILMYNEDPDLRPFHLPTAFLLIWGLFIDVGLSTDLRVHGKIH